MELALVSFALVSVVMTMTPGPTVLLALSNGSKFGVRRAGFGIAGAIVSDAVLITAAALGLGALLAASVFWFTVAKVIGVAYLVWLGVQMLLSSGGHGGASFTQAPLLPVELFRKSFLVAATNPKGYLFFTAFLPQFLDLSQPLMHQYLTLGAIFITVDTLVMAAYAGLGAKAVRFLSSAGAVWIDRLCGGLLIALGAALACLRKAAP